MSRRIFKLSIALLLVLFVLAAPVAAGTTWTPYEGISYGTCEGPEGQSWISGDRVLHKRGGVSYWYDEVSDPRLSGPLVLTVNWNFQLTAPPVFGYGPEWGTMRISNEGGYWEGHWVGERTEEGYSYITAVLHGYGDYQGLQARTDYVHETTDPSVPFTVHGVVMNPGGK